jgi:5-methylcytosine-specific restriction enzyme subunit McrC
MEHGTVDIPPELLIRGAHLDLYDEILSKNLFRVQSKGRRFTISAGNSIGIVPLNDRVAMEVNPRVPISNLEYLLSSARNYDPKLLRFNRNYSTSSERPTSILDTLADGLLAAVEGMQLEGIFKSYRPEIFTGTPSGRILPFESARAQMRRAAPVAVSSRFSRTTNNEVNRHIISALNIIADIYNDAKEREGIRRRRSRIAAAKRIFNFRNADHKDGGALAYIRRPELIPPDRPFLAQALTLSSVIIDNSGLRLRGGGAVSSASILIDMESVFEAYVRHFLSQADLPGYAVLDGNQARPVGAASNVFHSVPEGMTNPLATPDTVLMADERAELIIENKYKICGNHPERGDLNQAIVYGSAYRCSKVVLTYPAYQGGASLTLLGNIAGISIYKGLVSLSDADMNSAEAAFIDFLRPLLPH